jgi:sugar O-acyltransferase (sialic acid O-acetyltransferase NeuD family)
MKKKLLIIGASGHGKVVADIALKMKKWEQISFLDDNESIESSLGIKVVGRTNEAIELINDYDIFIGIGNNATRQRIQEKLEIYGASIPVLIHPNTTLGGQVELGSGTVLMAGAVINCCTKIGRGCIVNTGSTIDHDNYIENYVHVSPGVHLAGTVHIGQGSWLGIGSAISNNISITNRCIVGAGSVVVKDITEPGVYVGVPVRRV